MKIDLEEKSKELKKYVSQYKTKMFLGDISSLVPFIRCNNPPKSLQGLSSPMRQLLYLAALNVTSEQKKNGLEKAQYTDEEFDHIKRLLNEIEIGYEQYFYPRPEDVIDEEWRRKRKVAMPAFLDYFNQGLLNYQEQIIERIEEYFSAFNREISEHFNLSVDDFTNIFYYIDQVANSFLDEKINKKHGQQSWKDFCIKMEKMRLPPWDWQPYLPPHFKEYFEWMYDKGKMHRYSRTSLAEKFGKQKATAFLNLFTCKRAQTDFLYYTEENPLYSKPIFNIDDEEFQVVNSHHLIHAIYNLLAKFCISQPALINRFYAVRGKMLENKIEQVLRRFFNDKAFVYKSFYTQDKHEQDLLFLYKGLALIIEAKASKRDEPRRNPDMAYPLIESNFKETIQKGYDQTYRVKSKFINSEPLHIFSDGALKNHIIDIRTKNYHKAISIIVTLERFGLMQTDLNYLLDIYDNDEYPWSICIDDLEVFLLQMEKMGKKSSDLKEFCNLREMLHGRLFSSDELEVCGAFLNEKLNRKQIASNNIIIIPPSLTDIFDDTYQKEGLGFPNERNLKMKTSGKYLPIGGGSPSAL